MAFLWKLRGSFVCFKPFSNNAMRGERAETDWLKAPWSSEETKTPFSPTSRCSFPPPLSWQKARQPKPDSLERVIAAVLYVGEFQCNDWLRPRFPFPPSLYQPPIGKRSWLLSFAWGCVCVCVSMDKRCTGVTSTGAELKSSSSGRLLCSLSRIIPP